MSNWQVQKIKKYILYGQGDVLLRTADFLNSNHYNFAIFTAPRQKDNKLGKHSFEEILQNRGYPYSVIENLQDIEALESVVGNGALGLSFGAAWIFKDDVINLHDCGLVNFHGTCLPRDRGGGGFSWRILNNNRIGYSTVHIVTESVDAGPILMSEEYIFPEDCYTPKDYQNFAINQEVTFVKQFLNKCEHGFIFDLNYQNDYLGTYWPRLSTKKQGWIDWSWDKDDIIQFIRAFDDPYPGAMSKIRDEVVYLKSAFAHTEDGDFHPFQSGIIYRKSGNGIYVASLGGSIFVSSVTNDENVNMLSRIDVGDRFWTPQKMLEMAKKTRVRYTPTQMIETKKFD